MRVDVISVGTVAIASVNRLLFKAALPQAVAQSRDGLIFLLEYDLYDLYDLLLRLLFTPPLI